MRGERRRGAVFAALAACQGTTVLDPEDLGGDDLGDPVEERFVQPRAVPTDVVFLIDDRGQAARMQAALSSHAGELVAAWIARDADAHLAVVSASLQVPALFDDGDVTWAAAPGSSTLLRDAFIREIRDEFQHAARAMVKSVESGQSRPQDTAHLHAIVLSPRVQDILPWRFGPEVWDDEDRFMTWFEGLVPEGRRAVWTTQSMPDCTDQESFETCLAEVDADGWAAATDTRQREWRLQERPVASSVSVAFRDREDALWEGVPLAAIEGELDDDSLQTACDAAEIPRCFAFDVIPGEGRLRMLTAIPPSGAELVVRYVPQ